MKAIEMIPVPDDASEPMTLEAVIDAVTDFMGAREFGSAKWQALKEARHVEPAQAGQMPTDSQIWHGEYGQFNSEVVRPFVIGLSVVGASGFVRLVEDNGSTCIIDGRSLAGDELASVSGDWDAPPDLSELPDLETTAAAKFLALLATDIPSISISSSHIPLTPKSVKADSENEDIENTDLKETTEVSNQRESGYTRRGRPTEFNWNEINLFMSERYLVNGSPATIEEFIADIEFYCREHQMLILAPSVYSRGVRKVPSRSAIQRVAVPFKRRMDDALNMGDRQ